MKDKTLDIFLIRAHHYFLFRVPSPGISGGQYGIIFYDFAKERETIGTVAAAMESVAVELHIYEPLPVG